MAPQLAEEGNNQTDARRAALEEAASVLRAVCSGPGGVVDGDGRAPPKSPTGGGGGSARCDDGDDAAAVDGESAASPAKVGDGGTGGPRAPTPKLSRSDAVAAAKRRAEERKRASKHGGDRKIAPPPPSVATASSTTTTGAASSPLSSPSRKSTQPYRKRISASDNAASPSMDWFNLLGVVTSPSGSQYDVVARGISASSPSPSSHFRSRHGSHGLSSHGTPISLDHVGSDGTRGVPGGDDLAVAATLLAAAGLPAWADRAAASSASADAALAGVAAQLDEFTGWFDHYSRKYLGTIENYSGPILGEYGRDAGDGEGDLVGGSAGSLGAAMISGLTQPYARQLHPSMLPEYEPEFGPEDAPSPQLEELHEQLSGLDLAPVEGFLRKSGMLGMRFEDRGGGFSAARERRTKDGRSEKEEQEEQEEQEEKTKMDYAPASAMTAVVEGDDDDTENPSPMASDLLSTFLVQASPRRGTMADVESTVPEIFFSPYFDLTDPVCFENLLVISDEEVAQIREKEAELHALADRRVREAEEVARMDAENENVVARVPPRKGAEGAADGDATATGGAEVTAASPGTSLTMDSRTAASPGHADGDTVITLRKPETFTSHLDAVELVLLDQVRSKSERFFRETNRFSELQELVSTSVEEVRRLRTELHSIRERCVTNVEVIPAMDDQRRDLKSISRVLEAVEDVANCKASIASLMGAGDHLGAVEAIRLARELLRESPPPEEDEDDEDEDNEDEQEDTSSPQHRSLPHSSSHPSQQNHHLSLGKLKALSKVSEQLNQYENLVVQNLTDELVETFLSWGMSASDNGGGGGTRDMDYYRNTPPRISLSSDRRAEIRGVVRSLRVCGRLGGAGAAYRRKLCDLISVTAKAIVTECVADAAKNAPGGGPPAKGTMAGVASMSLDQFFDCINMLFEQVLGLLWGAFAVNKFCIDEGFILDDAAGAHGAASSEPAGGAEGAGRPPQRTPSATAAALAAAADLSEKSVSELLRLRREAHSLVSFDGMRRLWDTSLAFTHQLEKFSGRKAYGLRSTLLAQAKSFVERKHEANMSALVAALDSERWVQCSVSAERQAALTHLCSGRAAFSSRKTTVDAIASGTPASSGPSTTGNTGREKMADAEVEGLRYKVVWSSLLLLEMVMDDVACAAHFQTLATNVVGKVAELLRLFNTRATHLVLGAGAIHSAARLKSINAKHLAIVTQCSALVLAILPHVRAALMAQLPAKQHTLLYDLDKIKADYKEHSEKILSKLVSIIGGIVEHSLAPRIANTDFDARAKNDGGERGSPVDATAPGAIVECCQFLDNIVTNTRKMHQVLLVMLPAELLRDVFSRILAYLDHKVPSLFKAAEMAKTPGQQKSSFYMPTTNNGKLQMIKEVEYMARTMNGLSGVQPWNFTVMKVLEQELDISREDSQPQLLLSVPNVEEDEVKGGEADAKDLEKDEDDAKKEVEETVDVDRPDGPGSEEREVATTKEGDTTLND